MIDFTSTMAGQQQPRQLRLANGMEISLFSNQAELEHLILGSDRRKPKDVVLFGEGNFTFSIALASLRKNKSQGMTVTRYECGTLPDFDDVKKITVKYCLQNGDTAGTPQDNKLRNIEDVLAVPNFSDTWRAGIDATKIPADLEVAGKVVWFQCPWTHPSAEIPALIQGFMTEMACKQDVGDYLIIGVAAGAKKYIDKYCLTDIIGNGQEEHIFERYKFHGGDEELIKKILKHGYKHEGYKNIHGLIFNFHMTLVFKKEPNDINPANGIADANAVNRLLIEEKKEVVIFEEVDPSFSAALAILRGKEWKGIKMKSTHNISNGCLFSMMEQCIKKGEELGLNQADIIEKIKDIQDCPLNHIDHCREEEYAGKVIWYQLPPGTEVRRDQIENFMGKMADKQEKGDYLLIGTTTLAQYDSLKCITSVQGHNIAAQKCYALIGKDTELIIKIGACGYKHWSSKAMVLIYQVDNIYPHILKTMNQK